MLYANSMVVISFRSVTVFLKALAWKTHICACSRKAVVNWHLTMMTVVIHAVLDVQRLSTLSRAANLSNYDKVVIVPHPVVVRLLTEPILVIPLQPLLNHQPLLPLLYPR